MKSPTRRNRNIGTKKQGHGKDNALIIPFPIAVLKHFTERLGNYEKITKTINGHKFIFLIEETRQGSKHACSVADIAKIISYIPAKDYGDLEILVVLRQPKRKEQIKDPCWGRLIYSYAFEDDYLPAVILEAVDYTQKFKWGKKLSVDAQAELERLRQDGHPIVETKRHFECEYQIENVRNTQLYRTLPHEFGHYVHYLEVVQKPSYEDEPFEEWEKRSDFYYSIPTADKEKFAHRYADELKAKLIEQKVIPFEPL